MVKLIGVRAKQEMLDKAMEFLQSKLKNQRVFIKFDNVKYDMKIICFATYTYKIKLLSMLI